MRIWNTHGFPNMAASAEDPVVPPALPSQKKRSSSELTSQERSMLVSAVGDRTSV